MVSNAFRARKAPTFRILVRISSCFSHWKIATEIDSHVFKITLPTKPSHTTTSTGSSKRWRPSMLPAKLSELFFSILKKRFRASIDVCARVNQNKDVKFGRKHRRDARPVYSRQSAKLDHAGCDGRAGVTRAHDCICLAPLHEIDCAAHR